VTEQVRISSITGVDVELEIAGVGTRAYAFIIDWHIRFIVALALYFVTLLVATGSFAASGLAWAVMGYPPLVAGAVYVLYHPILEVAMHGRTPGKRFAGVRIVTLTGDTPGAGALLVRNVFRLVDALPTFYVVGLVTAAWTRHHVRVGDLAAGTLLVHERGDPAALVRMSGALLGGRLPPETVELADDLLERWNDLAPARRADFARQLLRRNDAGVSPDRLAALDDADLKARVRSLLTQDAGP